jgi:hypothetical protein
MRKHIKIPAFRLHLEEWKGHARSPVLRDVTRIAPKGESPPGYPLEAARSQLTAYQSESVRDETGVPRGVDLGRLQCSLPVAVDTWISISWSGTMSEMRRE